MVIILRPTVCWFETIVYFVQLLWALIRLEVKQLEADRFISWPIRISQNETNAHSLHKLHEHRV